jgi:hypothetical protein
MSFFVVHRPSGLNRAFCTKKRRAQHAVPLHRSLETLSIRTENGLAEGPVLARKPLAARLGGTEEMIL